MTKKQIGGYDAVWCAQEEVDAAFTELVRTQKAYNASAKAWIEVAKRRTPEEWRTIVDTITTRIVRIQAACIIWWDFFGGRPASDPWPHLDDYKSEWNVNQEADRSKVKAALVSAGYPDNIAFTRSHGGLQRPSKRY
jgi:hypothetical protein